MGFWGQRIRWNNYSIDPIKTKTKWFPSKSKMAAEVVELALTFECIHAIVIIFTSNHRFLGSRPRNTLEQLYYRSNHPKKITYDKNPRWPTKKWISSNFECIHTTVIILTLSHSFLGPRNTMDQLSCRYNHTKKQNGKTLHVIRIISFISTV